eukprot:9309990-Pyramimonas_sp.AAC.1
MRQNSGNICQYAITYVFGGQRSVGKSMCGIKGYGQRCALRCQPAGVCQTIAEGCEVHYSGM